MSTPDFFRSRLDQMIDLGPRRVISITHRTHFSALQSSLIFVRAPLCFARLHRVHNADDDGTGNRMNLHLSLTPLISLIAGILILVMPKLLNLIVAIYLIAIGLIGLFGAGALLLK